MSEHKILEVFSAASNLLNQAGNKFVAGQVNPEFAVTEAIIPTPDGDAVLTISVYRGVHTFQKEIDLAAPNSKYYEAKTQTSYRNLKGEPVEVADQYHDTNMEAGKVVDLLKAVDVSQIQPLTSRKDWQTFAEVKKTTSHNRTVLDDLVFVMSVQE